MKKYYNVERYSEITNKWSSDITFQHLSKQKAQGVRLALEAMLGGEKVNFRIVESKSREVIEEFTCGGSVTVN